MTTVTLMQGILGAFGVMFAFSVLIALLTPIAVRLYVKYFNYKTRMRK